MNIRKNAEESLQFRGFQRVPDPFAGGGIIIN
jgi:hypothetical protein